MRLIDADDLLEQRVYTVAKGKSFPYREAYKNMLYDIEHAPTIEAEPIRHGHWIESEEGYFSCSNCHNDAMVELYENSQKLTPFCPYCSAKMDEEV